MESSGARELNDIQGKAGSPGMRKVLSRVFFLIRPTVPRGSISFTFDKERGRQLGSPSSKSRIFHISMPVRASNHQSSRSAWTALLEPYSRV